MRENITLFFPHCIIIIHYCMASLDPASQKQSTTRLQVRSACSERQNRLAIYIVTGDARSPTAKQDSVYTCVLVYVCVVVSDYACMSACPCVSWQRNNYLNIVSLEISNSRCAVSFVIPRLVYLLQQQNCLTSLLGEGGGGWGIREEEGRGGGEGGEEKEVRLICIATIRVMFCNAQLYSSNYRGYPNECTFSGISSSVAVNSHTAPFPWASDHLPVTL